MNREEFERNYDIHQGFLDGTAILNRGHTRKRGVLHPSELAICPRMAQYTLMSEDDDDEQVAPTEKDEAVFQMGHWIHDGVQTALKKRWPNGLVEAPVWWPEEKIAGHADFVLPDVFVADIKSISPNLFDTLNGPKGYHVVQLLIYMFFFRVEWGWLYYVEKSQGKKRAFSVQFEWDTWAEIYSGIRDIHEATEKGELVEGTYSYIVCRSCGYRDACSLWKYRKGSKKDVPKEDSIPWFGD